MSRRPFIFLILAMIILLGAVVIRLTSTEAALPAPAPVELSSETMIAQLQTDIANNPEDAFAYAQLGLAYLQQVRLTGDASLYTLAEDALNMALVHDSEQVDALIGQGILALARHDFAGALVWAEQARALNPYRAQVVGIMVDAYMELGAYERAVEMAQVMVDLRPDLASYSRVSYVRELHGDPAGAILAMTAAVKTSAPGSEAYLWTQVQLGHLYFNQGDWAEAQAIYEEALFFDADYAYALAGLAHVEAANGNYEAAIARYERLVERLPLPEFVGDLADLYRVTGRDRDAQNQIALVEAMQRLNESAGMNVDLEMAYFIADHNLAPLEAVEQARGAYETRPGIYSADTLALALYHTSDYDSAWQYSQEALRLGTQDARLHYHAGLIAHARGDWETAHYHLDQALTINPAFSIRHAAHAQQLLQDLILAQSG